jgi:sugar porter (SP) family MFS transporter
MTEFEVGLVSSMFTLGGFLGALAAGPISATRGRVFAMQLTAIVFTIGPVFEALAPSIAIMSIGRFISGLGAGASVVVVPIYVSEIAPPAERGFFGSFTQVMVNLGIFVTQLLGYLLSYGQMWRIVFAAGGGIGLILGLGLFTVSESPKWLATHRGKSRQARDILQRIRGHKFDIEDEFSSWGAIASDDDAAGEEAGLLSNPDASPPPTYPSKQKQEVVGMLEAITNPLYRRAVVAVIMIMIAQQLTGINSIIMYGVHILSGLLESSSASLNLAVSLLNIVVTIICAPLIDRLGRKSCLLASISGMGISSIVLAFGIRGSFPILSAVAVILFVASFGVGLGPIPFILAAELVGPEAVNATQSWALGANWISTFLIAQFFPALNTALGGGIMYFIFAGIAAFFFTFVSLFVPETRGKKDADEVWGRVNERID